MEEKKDKPKGIKKVFNSVGAWFKGHKVAAIIILIILLALIGLLIYRHSKAAAQKSAEGEPEIVTVEKKDLVQSLTLSGTVQSGAAYSVTSQLADVEVKQVNVTVGDSVKKGDVIAVLDDTDLRENVNSASKNLSSAKKKNSQDISAAKKNLSNAKEDKKVQTGRADQDAKDAAAQYTAAVNEANALKNDLSTARSDLSSAEVKKNTAEANAKSVHKGIDERTKEIEGLQKEIETLEEEIIWNPSQDRRDALTAKMEEKRSKEVALNQYKKDNSAVLDAEADAQAAYSAAASAVGSLEGKVKDAEEKAAALADASKKAQETSEDTRRTTSRTVDEQRTALNNAYDSASDSLEAPKKELRKAQKDLDSSIVVADADGIVTAVNVKPGDKYKGDAIAVIQDDSSYRVSATADQYDISSLAVGQESAITITAAEMVDTEGKLIYVGSTPMVSETGSVDTSGGSSSAGSGGGSGATYRVEAVIQEPSPKMRIGMTGKVVVTVWKKQNCLAVPDEAIRTDENGNNYVVVINDKGKKHKVEVRYGMKTDYYSEIISDDIEEGMQIVVPQFDDGETDEEVMDE